MYGRMGKKKYARAVIEIILNKFKECENRIKSD